MDFNALNKKMIVGRQGLEESQVIESSESDHTKASQLHLRASKTDNEKDSDIAWEASEKLGVKFDKVDPGWFNRVGFYEQHRYMAQYHKYRA